MGYSIVNVQTVAVKIFSMPTPKLRDKKALLGMKMKNV